MKYITALFLIASVHFFANAVEVTSRCPLVRLQNGRVRTRGRGRIIRFSCYEGYTLVGNRYSTCIRGEWDTPTPVCVNSQCPELAKPDHALVVSKYDGAILIYFCEPGYKLIGTAEIYCDGRQWNGTSPYCRDTSAVAPTSCDFEKLDLCWWEQDPKHDFDWRRQNFETPSAHIGTGPTYDHTLGPGNDGYYLYIEASGRLVNDTARIISPVYNSSLTRSGCFSFWYHMYGDTIGALRVYFKAEVESIPRLMFNTEGNQGNRWLNGVFHLPAIDSNFQIIIEGVRGSNYVSDIAVDDVAILQNNECIVKNNTNVTVSDDDQIEILNAAQSCRGRCMFAAGPLDTSSSDALFSEAYCHCTLDCAENSTCCPDFAEYCVMEELLQNKGHIESDISIAKNSISPEISCDSMTQPMEERTSTNNVNGKRCLSTEELPPQKHMKESRDNCTKLVQSAETDVPSEATDFVDTTTSAPLPLPTKPLKIFTREEETSDTEILLISTKIFKQLVTPSVTENSSKLKSTVKPPKVDKIPMITVFISDTKLNTSVSVIEPLLITTQSRVESPAFITIDDVDTLKNDYNETQGNVLHVASENSQYTSSFGLPGIVGAVIGILAGVSISVVTILVILKKRKSYKRGANGSALSEDSDVRFLTSDEILDFNVARPATSDYNEL